jgi:hypothetical protein
MSTVAEVYASLNHPRRGPACTVGTTLARLEQAQADELRAMLTASPDEFTGTGIARTLTALTGQRVATYTLNRHRRGECTCE